MPGGTEGQLLWAILRKTYGWHKKGDSISIGQLAEMTGKSRRMVIYGLQNLEAKRMITITQNRGRGHINEINEISLQKNYDLWVVQEKSTQYSKVLNRRKELYQKYKSEGSARNNVVVQEMGQAQKTQENQIVQEMVNMRFLAPTKDNKEKKNVPTEASVFPEDSFPYRLANYLIKKITENFPKFKQPELQRWAKHVDLMIRIDKRDPDDIAKVVKWAQSNDFWKKNLLSTEKLRKQFDTIQAQMGGLR